MDPFCKFLTTFILTAVAVTWAVLTFNVAVDAYGVFWPPSDKIEVRDFEPNTRYRKIQYLVPRCSQYDTLIMGDSRIFAYQTSDINMSIGGRAYNLSNSAETVNGVERTFRALLGAGCKPKVLIFAVGLDAYPLGDPAVGDYQLLRTPHPLIQRQPLTTFVRKYAMNTGITTTSITLAYRRVLGRSDYFLKYDFTTGDIASSRSQPLRIPACPDPSTLDSREWLSVFERLVGFARSEGIQVLLVLNPEPFPAQLRSGPEATRMLFERLSQSFDGIFSLPLTDPRLRDPAFYLDPIHFKPSLVRGIFSRENFRAFPKVAQQFADAFESCGQNARVLAEWSTAKPLD